MMNKIDLKAEHRLIRKIQTGDRAAADQLLIYYEPFVCQLARKVAAFTGAFKIEEDLTQQGRIVLFEKALVYDFNYIRRRRLKEPDYRAARLSSYAFREMRRRMLKEACGNLEIVRIPLNGRAQRAHRELDDGGDPEEIAKRLGMKKEAVQALMRHTVVLDLESPVFGYEEETDEEIDFIRQRSADLRNIWMKLADHERLMLAGIYAGDDIKARAAVYSTESCRVTPWNLRIIEKRLLAKIREMLEAGDSS